MLRHKTVLAAAIITSLYQKPSTFRIGIYILCLVPFLRIKASVYSEVKVISAAGKSIIIIISTPIHIVCFRNSLSCRKYTTEDYKITLSVRDVLRYHN